MEKGSQALEALMAERTANAPHISPEAIEMIFRIEEQVQFDGDRGDAPQRIRDVIQATVERLLNG